MSGEGMGRTFFERGGEVRVWRPKSHLGRDVGGLRLGIRVSAKR